MAASHGATQGRKRELARTISAFIVTFALAALACGGSGGDDDDDNAADDDTRVEGQPCEDVTLGATSAVAGELVTLIGLEDVEADTLVRLEGPNTTVSAGIGRLGGDAFMAAPLHPDLLGEAGRIEVRLRRDGITCIVGDLDIEALPPADPDAADDALASLETLALQINQSFGFDPQTYDRTTTRNPSDVLQAVLYFALLDDDSPTSIDVLRDTLDHLPAIQKDVVARFIAASGLQEQIDELIVHYAGVSVDSGSLAPARPAVLAARASAAAPGECTAIFGDAVERASIVDADDLSNALKISRDARERLDREEIPRIAAGALLGGAALLGVAGELLSLVGSVFILVDEGGDQNSAFLLPSTISRVEMNLTSPNPIDEDYLDVPGRTRPRWFAELTAMSEGFSFSRRILDGIFLGAGILSLPDAAADGLLALEGASILAYPENTDEDSCFSVPAFSWSGISVAERRWLDSEPDLFGSSIRLVNTIEVDPIAIGETRISIDLDPNEFPCEGCVRFGDLDVGVAQKAVIFARAEYVAGSESDTVTVTGAIQNTSVPEQYRLEVTSGGTLGTVARNGQQFSIDVIGNGDRDLFPITVALESTSTNLPPEVGNRFGTTQVTLEPMVEIHRVAPEQGCIEPDQEVVLLAEVTGVEPEDEGVSWSSIDPIALTPIEDNQVVAVASAPGRYLVRATSIVDDEAFDEYEVVVARCEVQLFVHTLTTAEIDDGVQDESCGGSAPLQTEFEAETGFIADVTTDGTFAHDEDWTAGGIASIDADLQFPVVSTYVEPGSGDCRSFEANVVAQAGGSVSSQANSGQLDLDLDLRSDGACENDITANVTRECLLGVSSVFVHASFVIEMDSESSADYTIDYDLDCDMEALPGIPVSNVITNFAALDEAGGLIRPDEVLDFSSLIDLGTLAAQGCTNGSNSTLDRSVDFSLRVPEGDERYTFGLIVDFIAAPIAPETLDPDFDGIFQKPGSASGSIGVRAR